MPVRIEFDDADNPGRRVTIEAHPQTAVSPGAAPGTAIINTPDGVRVQVIGDYREVEVRLQAAAARDHGRGDVTQKNTPVN